MWGVKSHHTLGRELNYGRDLHAFPLNLKVKKKAGEDAGKM